MKQLGLERHGGRVSAGLIDAPVKRHLITYDH
jgi:hypothetical protein